MTTIQQAQIYKTMELPRQKILCDAKPFSRKLMHSLLKTVYAVSPPFTGYLELAGDGPELLFLFFFNGAPYAAGSYAGSKPVSYSIQEFGEHLAKSTEESMSITLCETDPVLLKCMLLFLQEEPSVKAPAALIDLETIVRQIGEGGADAMIALCRDTSTNFFFFRGGKGALVYYSDPAFERPDGMTTDEEMLLYAFQPGEKVQAMIYRDMVTTKADDSSLLDKDLLDTLFAVGYPKNRRRRDTDISKVPAGTPKNRRKGDAELVAASALAGVEELVNSLRQETNLPKFILSIESGPLQGQRFTVTLPCTLGRKACDVILNDHRISRRHAEIKFVDTLLIIEDLASTNGTRVNGETITRKQLKPSDLISIGPTTFRITPA